MKSFLIIPVVILFIAKVEAQSKKISFSSINHVGLVSGSKGESWMVQTINGFKKDKWFAGAGHSLCSLM